MVGQHPAQGWWLRVTAAGGEEREFGVEPTTLVAKGWAARPGGEGAATLLSMARNTDTARKYARVLDKWFLFCETGYLGRTYDPLVFTLAKWWLFAGFMLDPEVNRDKDLNVGGPVSRLRVQVVSGNQEFLWNSGCLLRTFVACGTAVAVPPDSKAVPRLQKIR